MIEKYYFSGYWMRCKQCDWNGFIEGDHKKICPKCNGDVEFATFCGGDSTQWYAFGRAGGVESAVSCMTEDDDEV
jgi:DnaJ-class molecular chaperone